MFVLQVQEEEDSDWINDKDDITHDKEKEFFVQNLPPPPSFFFFYPSQWTHSDAGSRMCGRLLLLFYFFTFSSRKAEDSVTGSDGGSCWLGLAEGAVERTEV